MPKKETPGRWRVQVTNHTLGFTWAIDDTRAACDAELKRRRREWKGHLLTVERARVG